MSRRRHDWAAIRAHYIEGIPTNPDGHNDERSWPTLDEVATLNGVNAPMLRNHAAREGWVRQREEHQRNVEQARRARLVTERAEQAAGIDHRAMSAADAGLALVGHALAYRIRQQTDPGLPAADRGKAVSASELAAFGLAARRWVQVKEAVFGRSLGDGDDLTDAERDDRDQQVVERVLAAQVAENLLRRREDTDPPGV